MLWAKSGCHEYGFTNTHPNGYTLTVTLRYGDFLETHILAPNQSASVTLPSDGVYAVEVGVLNLSNQLEETIIDHLFEICDLAACYDKLVMKAYCGDASDPCDGPKGAAKSEVMEQVHWLAPMVDVILKHALYDTLTYSDIADPDRAQSVADATTLIKKATSFIESCGLDCSGGTGDCGCQNCQ